MAFGKFSFHPSEVKQKKLTSFQFVKTMFFLLLSEIVHGNVFLQHNPLLCYFPHHLNWEDIFSDGNSSRVINEDGVNTDCPTGCHPSCNATQVTLRTHDPLGGSKQAFCWGAGQHQCQKCEYTSPSIFFEQQKSATFFCSHKNNVLTRLSARTMFWTRL